MFQVRAAMRLMWKKLTMLINGRDLKMVLQRLEFCAVLCKITKFVSQRQ